MYRTLICFYVNLLLTKLYICTKWSKNMIVLQTSIGFYRGFEFKGIPNHLYKPQG